MKYSYENIAKMIDHSLLTPTLTDTQLDEGCRLALAYDVATVCIMPYYLKRCTAILAGSAVKPSTTIGFPHGGHATSVKVAEAAQALDDGGQELDMVVNISKVLSGDWAYVRDDIQAVTDVVRERGAKVKVIFENCYLANDDKVRLCEICGDVAVDWVKTSTGFGQQEGRFYGATDDDLRLMKANISPRVQLKAAGGVRTLQRMLEMRELGCTRVGATATEAIMEEARRTLPQ